MRDTQITTKAKRYCGGFQVKKFTCIKVLWFRLRVPGSKRVIFRYVPGARRAYNHGDIIKLDTGETVMFNAEPLSAEHHMPCQRCPEVSITNVCGFCFRLSKELGNRHFNLERINQ